MSVLGIFFFDDSRAVGLDAAGRAPGGYGVRAELHRPVRAAFVEIVRDVRPDVEVVEPWRRRPLRPLRRRERRRRGRPPAHYALARKPG
jgi:hypothetical protein